MYRGFDRNGLPKGWFRSGSMPIFFETQRYRHADKQAGIRAGLPRETSKSQRKEAAPALDLRIRKTPGEHKKGRAD